MTDLIERTRAAIKAEKRRRATIIGKATRKDKTADDIDEFCKQVAIDMRDRKRRAAIVQVHTVARPNELAAKALEAARLALEQRRPLPLLPFRRI